VEVGGVWGGVGILGFASPKYSLMNITIPAVIADPSTASAKWVVGAPMENQADTGISTKTTKAKSACVEFDNPFLLLIFSPSIDM
jgi:hypothetical protein